MVEWKWKITVPWIKANANIPPVLVPPIQSNNSVMGLPVISSMASSICISTRPLIPPPSIARTESRPVFSLNIDLALFGIEPPSTESLPDGKSFGNN